MKSILKTVPKDLEMKYDGKLGSEINTEIMRDLIPRLVKSLKRYKVTYSQVRDSCRPFINIVECDICIVNAVYWIETIGDYIKTIAPVR